MRGFRDLRTCVEIDKLYYKFVHSSLLQCRSAGKLHWQPLTPLGFGFYRSTSAIYRLTLNSFVDFWSSPTKFDPG